jgi:uncharacterized protein YqfB (UPF0267 family)
MRREFSAGAVLVRRLRGETMVAAIRLAGKPYEVAEAGWLPLAGQARRVAQASSRSALSAAGSVRWPERHCPVWRTRTYDRRPVPAFALNFYSPIVEAQLRSHRKTATIRLGDKSRKYQKGMIVSVLVGARFSARQHVFDAVVDKVEVKTINELSPNEIEHDNPEIRHQEELCRFLGQLYNREVTGEDTITVIRFSAIKPSLGL